jgi:phosphatidylserine/phosphatidylglycerophosphate/cardiolipin synthase-like enzyme
MPDIIGRVLTSAGIPVPGLTVELSRQDPSLGILPFSRVTTGTDGRFTLTYSSVGALVIFSGSYMRVRVLTGVGRAIWESAWRSMDPFAPDWAIGDINMALANVSGWLVTRLEPGGTPFQLSDNAITLLIDNQNAWTALEDAVNASIAEINLQLFFWDIEHVFIRFTPDPPTIGVPTAGSRLEDLLVAANTRASAVAANVLIRDATLLSASMPHPTHTADEVEGYFARRVGHTIVVRRYPTDVRVPMHAKFVTFDLSRAQIIGSPLLQEYFDTSSHKIMDEPRRGRLDRATGSGGSINAIKVPIHDVGLDIRGPAVAHLRNTFDLHWSKRGASLAPVGPPVPAPIPMLTSSVQIVRSLPGSTFPGLPDGETTILEAHLRAFAQATNFIYIENQYLNAWVILGAIRSALLLKPALQIIVLLNAKVDIPGYQLLQDTRLSQLKRDLASDGNASRLGLYTLWTHEDNGYPSGFTQICRNYIHSKVMIADDAWAMAGSANMDGEALDTSEYMNLGLPTTATLNERATEVNAVVLNGIDGQPSSAIPGELRRKLWAEHLGLASPTDPLLMTRPEAGWLDLWQTRVAAKTAGLRATPPTVDSCRILEWRPEPDQQYHLHALGIVPAHFDIVDPVPSFDFTTGRWL